MAAQGLAGWVLLPCVPRRHGDEPTDRGGAPCAAAATIPCCGWVAETNNPDLGSTTMTDDKIALREMLDTGPDAPLPSEMADFVAQRLMDLEVGRGDRRRSWQS